MWVRKNLTAASGLESGSHLSLTHILPTSATSKLRSSSRVSFLVDLAIVPSENQQNVELKCPVYLQSHFRLTHKCQQCAWLKHRLHGSRSLRESVIAGTWLGLKPASTKLGQHKQAYVRYCFYGTTGISTNVSQKPEDIQSQKLSVRNLCVAKTDGVCVVLP